MAEVHLLASRLDRERSERLATALERILAASEDPGPRWPQIRALGLSLQQLSRDLEQEIDWIPAQAEASSSEVETLRDSLYRLAQAFSRLGSLAGAYPSRGGSLVLSPALSTRSAGA
ncbi:MAG: hypothetical protein CMH16_24550 [Methylobacterium sp.]|nr:hypothetical protein [Methylobacterium sp.]